MSYRFTNTDKWNDAWFTSLSQIEMLLFIYLCDNCDIAGFIEVNYKRWAFDLNSQTSTIEGACNGLHRGIIYSTDKDCIYLKNFLKHQRNLPIKENSPVWTAILKRFDNYRQKFNIQDVKEFIEGVSIGYQYPHGNSKGNSKGKEEGGMGEETKDAILVKISSTASDLSVNPIRLWMAQNNFSNISRMDHPFTDHELDKLMEEFSLDVIYEIVQAMENFKELRKKNTSANLTFRNWASRRGIKAKTKSITLNGVNEDLKAKTAAFNAKKL